jgi:peroxiredoxin
MLKKIPMKKNFSYCLALAFLIGPLSSGLSAATPPKIGDRAPDFTLSTLDHKKVRLNELTEAGNVVLVVLRGWPGYQCPFCTKQVHDFVTSAAGFGDAKAHVLMVYPGPAAGLEAHAEEFLTSKQWPKEFSFVIDPDYSMVSAYGLRWDAPKETAYPATFLLDKKGIVRFAKVSHGHGGRTTALQVLRDLKQIPNN